MIGIVVRGYSRPCAGVSGGVNRVWVFDPADFDWTQVATGDPYTAVARMAGATQVGGGNMFPIGFQEKEAEYKFTHSRTGCSVKYEHSLEAQLPRLSNDLTLFLKKMDEAGCCYGLGLVIEMFDSKIFVMGEMNVNTAVIPLFRVAMEGTTGTSGKTMDNFNGANVIFKGDYNRPLHEFTGGAAAIVALQ